MTHLPVGGEDAWTAHWAATWPAGPFARLGIGDDAAWLQPAPGGWLVTTDVLIDGVHARVREDGADALAWKALAVNVSDLAAMGAVPRVAVIGLVLPRRDTREVLGAVEAGLRAAATHFGVSIVGGDTNVADGPLAVAVTLLGTPGAGGVLTRSGALPGDLLSVTGPLGGSRAGRHLRPPSRVVAGEALALTGCVHAMMDLSDGLARDLPRLLRASAVGAVIDAERIPIHDDVRPATGAAAPPATLPAALRHALCDGEDFELLLAHAPWGPGDLARVERDGVALRAIGRVVAAREGLVLVQGGEAGAWPQGGWDHLGDGGPESP
jgi:thiamine-monophosphate kinase